MELDLQVSPEEIMSRAGLRKLDFFRFELSKWFVNSSATDIVLATLPSTAVETAIAQCTSRWAMTRGHRLNTSIVLAAVHGVSGIFRAVSPVEPSHFRPLPPLSPSLISHLASEDVKQNVVLLPTSTETTRLVRDGEKGVGKVSNLMPYAQSTSTVR